MKPRKKEVGKAGRVVADLLASLAKSRKLTYRAIATETGMSINRIGIIFRNEGPAVEVDELFAFCSVFEVRTSYLVAAAEWVVTGVPPVLEDEDGVDWQQIHALAATINPELQLPPELEQTPTPNETLKPLPASHAPTAPTPLFSHRRDDGYHGNEALPRMA